MDLLRFVTGGDSSGDMRTGECSIKVFIRNVLFFVVTGVYGGIGTCGKRGARCGDP